MPAALAVAKIESHLCQLWHCRPSELDEEDAYRVMQMLAMERATSPESESP